jgi:hypothetical protein
MENEGFMTTAQERIAYALKKDPREDKLPRWAQESLTKARYEAYRAHALAEHVRLDTKPAETDTLIQAHEDVPIGLEPGERVRFVLTQNIGDKYDHREYIDAHVERTHWGDVRLVLMAGYPILIEPSASNAVYVSIKG